MSQPAERRDLYAVDPFDEWNRRAQEHNDAVRERSLIRRAREFALERRRDAEQRTQDYVLSRQWALDRMEADHALRIAAGALDAYPDPHSGPVDDLGYPTMTEQEWIDRHGWHPPATPPAAPTPSPVDDEVETVEEDPVTGEVPAQPEVPPRKRGEHVEAWAARVLAANPTIGWKRLSTLVGGRDVLPESPARRVLDAHRARTSS